MSRNSAPFSFGTGPILEPKPANPNACFSQSAKPTPGNLPFHTYNSNPAPFNSESARQFVVGAPVSSAAKPCMTTKNDVVVENKLAELAFAPTNKPVPDVAVKPAFTQTIGPSYRHLEAPIPNPIQKTASASERKGEKTPDLKLVERAKEREAEGAAGTKVEVTGVVEVERKAELQEEKDKDMEIKTKAVVRFEEKNEAVESENGGDRASSLEDSNEGGLQERKTLPNGGGIGDLIVYAPILPTVVEEIVGQQIMEKPAGTVTIKAGFSVYFGANSWKKRLDVNVGRDVSATGVILMIILWFLTGTALGAWGLWVLQNRQA